MAFIIILPTGRKYCVIRMK